jgi:hypothetical protein
MSMNGLGRTKALRYAKQSSLSSARRIGSPKVLAVCLAKSIVEQLAGCILLKCRLKKQWRSKHFHAQLYRRIFLSLVCSLMASQFPTTAQAQAWSGLLATSRAEANWPNAGATIPSGSIAACATQPSSNTPAAISAAFAADAGGGSYCQINIPAGTYSITGQFNLEYAGKANVILSGAGANQTFFVYTPSGLGSGCTLGETALCVWNGDGTVNAGTELNYANSTSVSSGYSQGSTSLTLASHTNLKVGSLIQIAEADPATDPGNIWPCQSSSCDQTGSSSSPFLSGTSYSESQTFQITACGTSTYGASCTSNTVTISSPIYAPNWNSAQSPTAWWSSSLPIENVGVQNLSIDVSQTTTTNDDGGILIITQCQMCNNVWFSGVRQINDDTQGVAARNHMLMTGSTHLTVASSYLYGANPNANGYGVDWGYGTSDSIAYNNITQHMPSGYMMETSIGNVFAYNFSVDNYFGSNW